MASPRAFAKELSAALRNLKALTKRNIGDLEDDLGLELGRNGRDWVQYLKKGNFPPEESDIEEIIYFFIQRDPEQTKFNEEWADQFISTTEHRFPENALDNLFVRQEIEIAQAECPYPGLMPFTEEQAGFFFGRKEQIRNLRKFIEEGQQLITIVGASGSGKSSLVRAGLIPNLRQSSIHQLGETDNIYTIVPGTNPLEELALILKQTSSSPGETGLTLQDYIDALIRNHQFLHHECRAACQTQQTEALLLFIDQFEELFTARVSSEEKETFVENLLYATSHERGEQGVLYVMLTVRSDLYAEFATYPELSSQITKAQEYISNLSRDELCEIIEMPARSVEVPVESGLTNLLLRDLERESGDGILPLLQHTLREIWETRTGVEMTVAAYDAVGGIRGSIARYAEEVYQSLDEQQRPLARQIFLQLVAPSEDGNRDTKRRVAKHELIAMSDQLGEIEDLLEILTKKRLLLLNEDPQRGHAAIEIVHEALLTQWSELRAWIQDERTDLRFLRDLEKFVHEWKKSGRHQDYLLVRKDLRPIVEWHQNSTKALPELERKYLMTSMRRQRLNKVTRRAALLILSLFVVVGGFAGWVRVRQSMSAWQNINQGKFTLVTTISESLIDDELCIGTANQGIYCRTTLNPHMEELNNLTLPSGDENLMTLGVLNRIDKLTPLQNSTGQFYAAVRDRGIWMLDTSAQLGWSPISKSVPYTRVATLDLSVENLFAVFKSQHDQREYLYMMPDVNACLSDNDIQPNCWEQIDVPHNMKRVQDIGVDRTKNKLYLSGNTGLWMRSAGMEDTWSDLADQVPELNDYEIYSVKINHSGTIYLAGRSDSRSHVLLELQIDDNRLISSRDFGSSIISIATNPIIEHKIKAFILLESGEVFEVEDLAHPKTLGYWPNWPWSWVRYTIKVFPCSNDRSSNDLWLLMGQWEGLFEFTGDGYCST